MDRTERSGVIRLVEAEARIPGPAGERAVLVLQRGTLDIKLSIPIPPNQQTPHEQDELYVVIRGRGVLVHDDKRNRFDSGDILFVAAGVEHHYETSAMIWLCGAYSMAVAAAKSRYSRWSPATGP